MAHKINEDVCIGCGTCQSVCPVECISEVDGGKRRIDADMCVDCGACAASCPVECISAE